MGDGLKRARAAAKATRTVKCPVCGKPVVLRLQATEPRIPVHGPKGNPCAGSRQVAK